MRGVSRAIALCRRFADLSARHAVSLGVGAPQTRAYGTTIVASQYSSRERVIYAAHGAYAAAAAIAAATLTCTVASSDTSNVRVEGTRRQLYRKYKLGRVLGEGSFAFVRQAVHK